MPALQTMSLVETTPDITILGAGVIGLAIALELCSRGAHVRVLERGAALGQASIAAAGMLAAHDPHNPLALTQLAELSLDLYPAFLERIADLTGIVVPFQTESTIQHVAHNKTMRMAERSLDPRQLASALLTAVRRAGVDLREHQTADQCNTHRAGKTVYAQGAWAAPHGVFPRKGQMLRVALPPAHRDLCEVHRSEPIYIVPRTTGPQAGSAILGATVEDAGFDTTVSASDLSHLRTLAAQLLPAFGDETAAPQLEAWAGVRPATADQLPLLGMLPQPGSYVAAGHYRNGILLAPATAVVLADLIEGKLSRVDLQPFLPQRLGRSVKSE